MFPEFGEQRGVERRDGGCVRGIGREVAEFAGVAAQVVVEFARGGMARGGGRVGRCI
jgi:hypothetical protein